jgi:LytS/YehU family sensor histidine kinase
MLRYTVEASERPAALLSEEIDSSRTTSAWRANADNPLAFEYHGTNELLSTPVPPLLLQPLVENSLKHGCAPGEKALTLTLEARQRDGWFTLDFADDGDTNGNGGPGLGVGLQNLEQRLVRFAGSKASMEAGPREHGGFHVTLRWPLEREAA